MTTPPAPSERTRRQRPSLLGQVAATLTVLLLAAFVVIPTRYAVEGPGPTENVLGSVPAASDGGSSDGGSAGASSSPSTSATGAATDDAAAAQTPLIAISGADVSPTTGTLLMTTVSGWGSPSDPLDAVDVLRSWWSRKTSVVPLEVLYPPGRSEEETNQTNAQDMTTSQQDAVVAALTELGYDVPATITVLAGVTRAELAAQGQDVSVDAHLAGDVVKKGDVVTSVQGVKVATYQDMLDEVARLSPGQDVTLGILRGGKPTSVTLQTIADPTKPGAALLGLYLDPTFDPPVDVDISLGQQIGGPSAGSTFALGIIDKLSGGDLTGGTVVASTGTIALDGTIGPIGGIRQKMYGAQESGATAFLAPASNCDEVVGHVPHGLSVYAVGTLHEAREALTAIGRSDTGDLKVCGATGAVPQ